MVRSGSTKAKREARFGRDEMVSRIRAMIEEGALAPGDRLPSEREFSERFATSRAAVKDAVVRLIQQGVLQQKPNCRPTVAELRSALPEGGGKVAVWMQPDLHDFGTTLILEGIRQTVGSKGRQLLVSCPRVGDRDAVQRSAVGFFESAMADPTVEGFVVWPSDDAVLVPIYREIAKRGVPLVFVDREPPEALEADVVAADHFRGAKAAMRHLIELGHRRIAMVGNDDRVSSVRDRTAGYYAALGEVGISLDEGLMVETAFMQDAEFLGSVETALDDLLGLDSPPTALFAVNDQIAMHLQDALRRRGVAVPGEVSIVGFDWLLRSHPFGGDLTTVAQPFDEIGRTAARRLFERAAAEEPPVPCHFLLPAPLVAKSTSGPLRPSSVASARPRS